MKAVLRLLDRLIASCCVEVLGIKIRGFAALLVSIEADLYPRDAIDKSDLVDGAIGELSQFHETFGYYAHGVDDTTATLPAGWQQRLVVLHNDNTGGATGWCLEVHDLASSKLTAGRERDREYVRVLLRERMIEPATLEQRVRSLPLSQDRIDGLLVTLRQLTDAS